MATITLTGDKVAGALQRAVKVSRHIKRRRYLAMDKIVAHYMDGWFGLYQRTQRAATELAKRDYRYREAEYDNEEWLDRIRKLISILSVAVFHGLPITLNEQDAHDLGLDQDPALDPQYEPTVA